MNDEITQEEIDNSIYLVVDNIHVLITEIGVSEKKEEGKTGIYFVHRIIDGIPDDLETFRDKIETILINRINFELDDWLNGIKTYE